jgi:hypothetical protein
VLFSSVRLQLLRSPLVLARPMRKAMAADLQPLGLAPGMGTGSARVPRGFLIPHGETTGLTNRLNKSHGMASTIGFERVSQRP